MANQKNSARSKESASSQAITVLRAGDRQVANRAEQLGEARSSETALQATGEPMPPTTPNCNVEMCSVPPVSRTERSQVHFIRSGNR